MAGTGVFKSATAESTLACLLFLLLTLVFVQSAPASYPEERFLETTELAEYGNLGGSGAGAGPGGGLVEPSDCYYNFQRYAEGDRIVTNEPCLNCTCHSRMLMCYLRVCPFSKAIGQDCKVEKRPDQCCPVITCPEVPVHLLTSTSTTEKVPSDTAVAFPDTYGCSIDGRFFPDGVQVPSNPEKPCELCYCIRNRTACVMQECTLQVEGCKPVLQPGVCCPVRYDCDYGDEPSATERPPPSGLILSTPTTPGPAGCTAGGYFYRDGDRVRGRTPCEHCYCMRGDVVCAVQECGPALQGCHALPPKPGRCCADAFQCANGTVSLEILSQDQNLPESAPVPIPAGSAEDKHQVSSTSGLPTEAPQTESQKDNVATEEKYPATEKYEPTTIPSLIEVGTPVKGVKGEVGYEEPTTMKFESEQPSRQPEDESPEGTTTRVQLPEVDPVKDPVHSESGVTGAAQPDDSLQTTASPADKEPAPFVESHDVSEDNTLTVVSVQNNEEPNVVTTEPSALEVPTPHLADDKLAEAPVTSEPVIETINEKTTATFVTTSDEYTTPNTPVVKQTCEKQGHTFQLLDPVPASLVTENPCVVNCTCQRHNAITCGVINCPPSPPHHKNCVPIRHEGVCCPTYACDGIEAPEPESDSQMGVSEDGSDKGDEVTTNAPKAEAMTMVTVEYSRQTTAAEDTHYVPLKEATTALPNESYQPTTVPPVADSSENEPAAPADKIDKPTEDTQAAPDSEHKPFETEQHTYDEGAHSHDGEETHEDSETHFDHEEPAQTSAPEDAGSEEQPATEEPHKPEPVEDHAHTEDGPSLQESNKIEEPTQKPVEDAVTAVPEEEKHEAALAGQPTTHIPEDTSTASPVSTDESESENSPDDKPHESMDSDEPAPVQSTSSPLDHTDSPIDSDSQVTTDRSPEENAIPSVTATSAIVNKDSQPLHEDNAPGSSDDTPSHTTEVPPLKEEDTITEQEKYPSTGKPAELSSAAIDQPEHDTPAPSETSESLPIEHNTEADVAPTSSAQIEEVQPGNIQSGDTSTNKPVESEVTEAPSEVPTDKPGEIASDAEPATAAPVPTVEDAPATDSPGEVVYSTDEAIQPGSSEFKGPSTTVPEVTEAPAAAHLDETPGESPSEVATESVPEPLPNTDRPAESDKKPSSPEVLSEGTSAPLEESTGKPAAPVLEDQAEKGSEAASSVTEGVPETPNKTEAPSYDPHQDDLSEEISGTEEPSKVVNKEPEQPYVTVLPFEEATPEKVNEILHDTNDKTSEASTDTPLALEASTEAVKPQSPDELPTHSPVALDGSEETAQVPISEGETTDKPIAHPEQSTEGSSNIDKERTTVQSEILTELPSADIHTEAIDTDQHSELILQPTTETPLKFASSESNEPLTTESSASSSSSISSSAEENTQLPEHTPQPVADIADEELRVTTLETPIETPQDNADETPAEVSHDHSDGTPSEISQDHTEETPGEISPDLADAVPNEVGPVHQTEGALLEDSHDHSDDMPDEVTDHTEETPAEASHDHTDATPVESIHDHAVQTPDEIPHDHTDGTPIEASHDHTEEAPVATSHDQTETPVEGAHEDHTEETLQEVVHQTEGTPVQSSHNHTDATPVEQPADLPENIDHVHGDATEVPYSPETPYPTQPVTEAPTQSQTEPSSNQIVDGSQPESPAQEADKPQVDEMVHSDSDEPSPTNGEALVQTTTEKLSAPQTSPESTETAQPHHDDSPNVPQQTVEEYDRPEGTAAAPEIHVTEASIATVIPEHDVHIPVENQEAPAPVESEPVETVTQQNAEDKYETVPPSSSSVTASDVQPLPAHDTDSAPVETDIEVEQLTTAPPDISQGLKGQSSIETTAAAPTEPAHVTASEEVVSQTTPSQSSASSTEESVKESSTSSAEVELPTTTSLTQEKEPSSPEQTPSSGLLDQEELTTQSLSDRYTTVSPHIQEQSSALLGHPEKRPDYHVTEQAVHAEPEQSTSYPSPQKERPTTVSHEEPTAAPQTTTTEHKYSITSSPVTEASSKAPFHGPGDDFEDQEQFHEHEYTHIKDPVPTVPPHLFGGGHVEDEHPAYGSHLPTTPSHNPFGPPDEPFPVDSYTDDEDPGYGPGTCRYAGKVYVSAQQIPRDDPCDFCFCFRSDIICLQQSCPPPIPGCHEEPISGFCCPRYECPVSMATSLNLTTTSTTTTTTLPPHFLPHAYHGAATRTGCQVRGVAYRVGETVRSASGPCLHCRCGGDGQMQCEPKVCSPEPMLRKMIAAAATRRR